MPDLAGKRVLVTGAAGGFGTAIMQLLRDGGARAAGIDLHDGESIIACDITDGPSVDAAVAAVRQQLGGLDVLVNNAGIGTAAMIADGWGEHERAVLDVNVGGTWTVTAAALPHLREAGGHVITIASLLAVVNMPFAGAYVASKRALVGFSDVLRAENRDRLSVTTIYPGYAATAIHGPAEARSGRSLKGLVPEETPGHIARAVERAIRRRPRDLATTPYGHLVLRLARSAPAVVDGVIARRVARRGLLPTP